MPTQFQFRRGTEAQWSSANPVLADGELALSTDKGQFKMGNGTSAWSALAYIAAPISSSAAFNLYLAQNYS